MDELIDSFSPTSRPVDGNWSGPKLQPEIQTVVDDFYDAADEALYRTDKAVWSKLQGATGFNPGGVSTPARLGYALDNYPELKKQLFGSEQGKAFINTLNGLSKSLKKFAAVDVPKEKPTPSRSYKDTLKDLQPMAPGAGPTRAKVEESKKKGSDMNVLFEGWRKFIE